VLGEDCELLPSSKAQLKLLKGVLTDITSYLNVSGGSTLRRGVVGASIRVIILMVIGSWGKFSYYRQSAR